MSRYHSFVKANESLINPLEDKLLDILSFVENEIKEKSQILPNTNEKQHKMDIVNCLINIAVDNFSFFIYHLIDYFYESEKLKKAIIKLFEANLDEYLKRIKKSGDTTH